MTQPQTASPLPGRSLRAPVLWGIVWGAIQAAAPLGFARQDAAYPADRIAAGQSSWD
jgi:hypothetical protein